MFCKIFIVVLNKSSKNGHYCTLRNVYFVVGTKILNERQLKKIANIFISQKRCRKSVSINFHQLMYLVEVLQS